MILRLYRLQVVIDVQFESLQEFTKPHLFTTQDEFGNGVYFDFCLPFMWCGVCAELLTKEHYDVKYAKR